MIAWYLRDADEYFNEEEIFIKEIIIEKTLLQAASNAAPTAIPC
jgi:hypothetical protein